MSPYQIRDWEDHFENNKSRERDQCSYIAMPNKQHGMGFIRVISDPDGAAIFGLWALILQACSQQKRPRAGWLTDDGTPEGSPWTAEDLSLRWRQPLALVERALELLSSERVGWLIKTEQAVPAIEQSMPVVAQLMPVVVAPITAKCPSGAPAVPVECPSGASEGKRIEKNRREKKKPLSGASPDALLVFEYWRVVMDHPDMQLTKERSVKVHDRLKDGYTVGQLKQAIDGCKRSPHHMGHNEQLVVYDDLELICRDATKVEKFIGFSKLPVGPIKQESVNGKHQQQPTTNGIGPRTQIVANRDYSWANGGSSADNRKDT